MPVLPVRCLPDAFSLVLGLFELPTPIPWRKQGFGGEVGEDGRTSEKRMAMVFNKLCEERAEKQGGVGGISGQALGSPHLLGWLSPQC